MEQQVNISKNVTIELTPAQVSVVLAHLRKGTYEQVATVLNSIETQIIKQVQTTVTPVAEPTNGQ